MNSNYKTYLIHELRSALVSIARSDDWFRRSEIATRATAIIDKIGRVQECYFSIDPKWLMVDDIKVLRKYREKLDVIVDAETQDERDDEAGKFWNWLRIIGLRSENDD